jgi:hypothetical protein
MYVGDGLSDIYDITEVPDPLRARSQTSNWQEYIIQTPQSPGRSLPNSDKNDGIPLVWPTTHSGANTTLEVLRGTPLKSHVVVIPMLLRTLLGLVQLPDERHGVGLSTMVTQDHIPTDSLSRSTSLNKLS